MSTRSDDRTHPGDPTSTTADPAIAPLRAVPNLAPLEIGEDGVEPVPDAEGGAEADERTADLDSIVRFISHDMNAAGGMVAVYDGRPGEPRVYASWGLALGLKVLDGVAGGGAIGHSLARGRTVARRLGPAGADNGTRIAEALAAPVRSPSGLTGALCVGVAQPLNGDRERELKRLTSYAGLVGLWLDDSETLVQLLRAASEDGLTGCVTYPTLVHELESEIMRSQRTGQPLSCLFIDVDNFKQVNEHDGHLTGDEILRAVGATLRLRVRETDTVGRFGGDEFVVLLPDTGGLGAGQIAHALSEEVRTASMRMHGGPVSVSIGVSQLASGMSHQELLEHADRALRDRQARR